MGTGTHRFPPSEVSPEDVARIFGQRVAEKPILDDMRTSPALGNPGAFGLFIDESVLASDENMIGFITTRNNLPRDRATAMLDYRHRRGAFATEPPNHWARPDALCHTSAAREYYEIKPLSATGIAAANEKFPKIDKFIRTFNLPYARGVQYLSDRAIKRKELELAPGVRTMLRNLLTMFKLKNIRVFVVWERPQPGMILYTLQIEVETADERTKKAQAMRNLARFVLRLVIQDTVPEARLVAAPKGVTKVELPEELRQFTAELTNSAGGLVIDGAPGEEHLLVIDDAAFQRIIDQQRRLPVLLRTTGRMFAVEEWRRVLREAAAEEARIRDRAILVIGVVLVAGVALYVCWPVIAAGATTVTVGGASTVTTEVGMSQAGSQLATNGGRTLATLIRGQAANDNAVAIAQKAAGFAVGAGFVFAATNAEAAERIARTGVALLSDLGMTAALLLRPNIVSASIPGLKPAPPLQFGDVVDPSLFPELGSFPANPFEPQAPKQQLRLIGKVKFE